jgi:pimeloyl-ACP methyl ester carboxylesterase
VPEFSYASDGTPLFAVEQGEGPTVLLFHGGGATHHACLGLAAHLAEGHRVVTPDLRGSGRSWDALPLTWDRLARTSWPCWTISGWRRPSSAVPRWARRWRCASPCCSRSGWRG